MPCHPENGLTETCCSTSNVAWWVYSDFSWCTMLFPMTCHSTPWHCHDISMALHGLPLPVVVPCGFTARNFMAWHEHHHGIDTVMADGITMERLMAVPRRHGTAHGKTEAMSWHWQAVPWLYHGVCMMSPRVIRAFSWQVKPLT